jgi:hypothetical protein
MNWNAFKLNQEYLSNTIILYIVFAFIIGSIYIIVDGLLNVVNISDNFKSYFYFAAGMIPISLIRYILDMEYDLEEE